MSNNFFTVCSLFYIILLNIVYFSKPRIKSLETKIFQYMVVCNLITIVLAVISYFTIQNSSNMVYLNDLVSKSLLLAFFWWGIFFTVYAFSITFEKQAEKILSKNMMFLVFMALCIVFCIVVCLNPLYYHSEKNVIYSYGPAANLTFLSTGLDAIIYLICLIYALKHGINRKYIPLIIYMVVGGIVVILQKVHPELLLVSSMETFVTFLMFFTIENPDVKMIEQLNLLKDQADKANRAKTEFLSSMSHEIRTPLNAIVGFSNTLNENPKLPDELRDEVKDILTASDNLLEIVNGVLDISKIEANKIEIVNNEYDTKKIFDELAKLTKARIGEKPIEFNVKIDESIPRVLYGDHVRVKQVILNLLTNAAKYTDSGKIDFTVNSVKKDDIIRLIVSVEDTGRGIKEENINKLFTKFERLDEERNTTIEGTGLGLAITKKLVDMMNGKIVVQSKYGKGSKFTVSIDQKIVKKPTINLDETAIIMESMNLKGKKVLLVDDNKLNIKVASKLLETYNVDITALLSGEETLDLLKKDNKFDIILLDDMMPKLSGTDTLKKIKEDKLYDGPIVVLTANALTGEKEKYLGLGFDDYLAKPIEKIELNRVLKKYLKNK